MNKLDNEFFETYKDVERYCSDKLNCEHGVSEYILELEKNHLQSNKTYKSLKHLRWVRNQIAHNSDDISFSTVKDLEDLISFYNSLKTGKDILSYTYKAKKSNQNTYKQVPVENKKEQLQFGNLIKAFLFITILFIIYLLIK